jgi:hypothetical protein
MSRKTIKVDELRIAVNEILAVSVCSADVRQGQLRVLEHVLHSTDNYRGFRFLSQKDVPAGEKPGINLNADGSVMSDYVERFLNTDSTRVQYL